VTGIELVVGYLAAWGVRKLKRAGQAVDVEADRVLDGALERLHETVSAKLGADPAVVKLDVAPDQVSERTRRRVEDALAEAMEDDRRFAEALEQALTAVREAEPGASEAARIDLRGAQGVQVGDHNQQVNVFGAPPNQP
jgi:hypothetical protein